MAPQSDARARRLVLIALLLSGIASILNQVLWQRALKLFLGGSESISSMIVVLVFMLGLGIGSGLAGARSDRIRDPLRAFGLVELALFAANAAIALLLSLDLGESVYAAQRLALSAQIPLRLVYAVGALVLLLPPTILMGATLPLAAEACQRQLGATESRLITILLALNTVGACIGAIGSSFFLLPYLGQRMALGTAAVFNLAAGSLVLALAIARRRAKGDLEGSDDVPGAPASKTETGRLAGGDLPSAAGRRPFSREEALGFALGFLSLGYEMYLLRLVCLAHEPRPYTFAFTLLFFLLFWTLGVWLAGRMADRSIPVLAAGALLVALMPIAYDLDRWTLKLSLHGGGLVYFLPCVCFGLMYGRLVSDAASTWGRDVGRFYALNTLGSCLGILFFTLVGYEIPHDLNAGLIAIGLLAILCAIFASRCLSSGSIALSRGVRALQLALGAAALALLGSGLTTPYSESARGRAFWGRDGVVEVFRDGSIWIDGLWHSHLSNGKSHIGNPYNWMMVVAGVLAHRDEPLEDALVVGNGIGITAVTLTRIEGLEVDAYEINRTLAKLLALEPARTLYSATHPRIRIRWQDGRSGLALDPKRYDLIISAPLHLRAAGSSNLLSREYLALARSRLKEHGVLVLYSQEGRPEQGELIRATVRSVFAYSETFLDGVLTVASDTPIEITAAKLRARLEQGDPLAREMADFDRMLRRSRQGRLFDRFDSKRLPVRATEYRITDDHPLVEYAEVTARLLGEAAPAPEKSARD
ncbi:methyltransferase [Myxococcota bacterium]|nr:methyltransferase [Myxococcota bacterium]